MFGLWCDGKKKQIKIKKKVFDFCKTKLIKITLIVYNLQHNGKCEKKKRGVLMCESTRDEKKEKEVGGGGGGGGGVRQTPP